MSAVEEIRVKLETRLQEVQAEIESLRAGLDALESQAAAESQAEPASPPSSRRSRKVNGHEGAKRKESAKLKASRAELEQMLAQAGGPEAVELARDTGADYGAVLARIRELEQAGRPRG